MILVHLYPRSTAPSTRPRKLERASNPRSALARLAGSSDRPSCVPAHDARLNLDQEISGHAHHPHTTRLPPLPDSLRITMASVLPPPHHLHDTYTSRFQPSLSTPPSLSALGSPLSLSHSHPRFPPPPYRGAYHPSVEYHPHYDPYAAAMPPPPLPRKRNRSASPSSPSGDSEYDPGSKPRKGATAAKLPPGHKIGPNGRPMSREQLRKANHSLIERRRREKINSALADLRGMVPGLGEENGGKGGEFKLEVSHKAAHVGAGAGPGMETGPRAQARNGARLTAGLGAHRRAHARAQAPHRGPRGRGRAGCQAPPPVDHHHGLEHGCR